MTLDDLASEVGVKSSSVTKWQNGEIAAPRRATLERIDECLRADGAILRAYGYGALPTVGHDHLGRDVTLPAEITQLPVRLAALERKLEVLSKRLDRLTAHELAAAEQDAVESTSRAPSATDADHATARGDRGGRQPAR